MGPLDVCLNFCHAMREATRSHFPMLASTLPRRPVCEACPLHGALVISAPRKTRWRVHSPPHSRARDFWNHSRPFQSLRPWYLGTRDPCRSHATASWAYLLRSLIKLLSSSSSWCPEHYTVCPGLLIRQSREYLWVPLSIFEYVPFYYNSTYTTIILLYFYCRLAAYMKLLPCYCH